MIRHTIRTKSGEKEASLTYKKAIRYFCAECMGWQEAEVRRCSGKLCPLWPFRTNAVRSKLSGKSGVFRGKVTLSNTKPTQDKGVDKVCTKCV